MHPESSTLIGPATPRNGVLVLTGYGVRVAVERGHLIASDGRGRERREGRFPRANRQLRRLVVLGHTGSVSFEALRWLRDVGCAFVHIDGDGAVVVASGASGLDDPRLRRAQAMAATNGVGVSITRDLLERKITGQASVLDLFGASAADQAADYVRGRLSLLAQGSTPERFRSIEADAAAHYWGAWSGVPVRWARRDAERVPDGWTTFGLRSSPLTGSPRSAANPANALLNYAYAILEAEARIAALAVGLDPGLGVLHADLKARDSLVLDLMEAVRPEVDGWLLSTLRARTFRKADFHETREGICRLMPALAKLVAETMPRWAEAVAPVTEGVARALMESATRGAAVQLATPLRGANRRVGRGTVRGAARRKDKRDVALPLACEACGGVLAQGARSYCDDCLPAHRVEQAVEWSAEGVSTLARLRMDGRDPAHGDAAGRKRGARNATHVAAITAWDSERGDEPVDLHTFARDILPRLQSVPLRLMAEATGLSEGYCSFVRRGQKTPHPRHWPNLMRLTEATD
ncbi:MAG: CRISPR-associated endonuclease Cas1 [Chloroflexota bacterium]|nr:CRISPR-associated endonuclease Cas1 [Chloroflexota bacterium]